VTEKDREWDFKVHKEIMFEEEAEPEQGTKAERKRICVPFPIELSLPNGEAFGDFEIHVEGWKNFAYYSPGAPSQAAPNRCGPIFREGILHFQEESTQVHAVCPFELYFVGYGTCTWYSSLLMGSLAWRSSNTSSSTWSLCSTTLVTLKL